MTADLAGVAEKVRSGQRLDHGDGMRLYRSRDIFTIGRLADEVRRRLHGRIAYYNINRHIHYTNYCVLRCRFCSFFRPYSGHDVSPGSAREPGRTRDTVRDGESPALSGAREPEPGSGGPGSGYALRVEDVVRLACEARDRGATEVHIVGGLHPKLPFSYYLDLCRGIRAACPTMHIKAFTAIEIIHFTRIARPRLSIVEVLEQLREAGLGSLPGGGAEIFDDRVHEEAFRSKVGEQGWFDVHRAAHALGIFSNATMLYGHVERPEERIAHMIKLREHQDASLRERRAHFQCFIPLPFIPEGSGLAHLPGTTGLDDLKTLAIARLMLDNVPHMQGPKIAQVSLDWGVDDLDGTVVHYDITKRDGAGAHQEMTADQLRRLIIEAGRVPVERDTLYRPVDRRPTDPRTAGPEGR